MQAISAIQNTQGMYGADSINFLAVLTNISYLSWGVAVVGEGMYIQCTSYVPLIPVLSNMSMYSLLKPLYLALMHHKS